MFNFSIESSMTNSNRCLKYWNFFSFTVFNL